MIVVILKYTNTLLRRCASRCSRCYGRPRPPQCQCQCQCHPRHGRKGRAAPLGPSRPPRAKSGLAVADAAAHVVECAARRRRAQRSKSGMCATRSVDRRPASSPTARNHGSYVCVRRAIVRQDMSMTSPEVRAGPAWHRVHTAAHRALGRGTVTAVGCTQVGILDVGAVVQVTDIRTLETGAPPPHSLTTSRNGATWSWPGECTTGS